MKNCFRGLLLPLAMLLLSACHALKPTPAQEFVDLKIEFFDYKPNALHWACMDSNNQMRGEWHDVVSMRVLGEGQWQNIIFMVIISEHPVREMFRNGNAGCMVRINQERLLSQDSSGEWPQLLSGDVELIRH